MQEEVNKKVIAVSIETTKLTAEILQKALNSLIEQMKQQNNNPVHHRGKQTLKQLMSQNTGISNIEITNDNIRIFEKTAKKYGIDFAVKRVQNDNHSRYLVFFKGRDTDVLTAAFQEFSMKKLHMQDKPSIRQMLSQIYKEHTQSKQPKQKVKEKETEL